MLALLTSYDLMRHSTHVNIIPKFVTNLTIGIRVKISISVILSKLKQISIPQIIIIIITSSSSSSIYRRYAGYLQLYT